MTNGKPNHSWGWLPATKKDIYKLMAKVTEAIKAFSDQVQTGLDKLSTDLGGIKTEIADLNALVQTLQNSPGEISPEDQATLDAVSTKVQTLVNSADALTVPTVPPPPTV